MNQYFLRYYLESIKTKFFKILIHFPRCQPVGLRKYHHIARSGKGPTPHHHRHRGPHKCRVHHPRDHKENQKRLYQPFVENKEPLQLELQNFVDSILRDEPPKPSGEDGLKALKICEAALKSAKIGRPVKLKGD